MRRVQPRDDGRRWQGEAHNAWKRGRGREGGEQISRYSYAPLVDTPKIKVYTAIMSNPFEESSHLRQQINEVNMNLQTQQSAYANQCAIQSGFNTWPGWCGNVDPASLQSDNSVASKISFLGATPGEISSDKLLLLVEEEVE